jgi:anaerobic ribonucleoside-triphosphate reductase activating protein
VLKLLKICKEYYPEKDIWCYTGYVFDEVKDFEGLDYIDVLVDGRYIEEERDVSLQFRGSSNQRIIDVPETRMSGKIKLWVSSDGWRS